MNTVVIFLVVILLIIISMVDIKYKLIYDWHLLLLFIVISSLLFIEKTQLVTAVSGSLSFGGTLFLLGILGKLLFKKEAMGNGDTKLGFILGLLLGWKLSFLALYICFISASVIAILYKYFLKNKIETIPFAPFLSFGIEMPCFFA